MATVLDVDNKWFSPVHAFRRRSQKRASAPPLPPPLSFIQDVHPVQLVFPDSSSLPKKQAPSSTFIDRITTRPPSSPSPYIYPIPAFSQSTIQPPNRTMSDPSKLAPQPNSVPVKRASSLMTIPGFRFRRSRDIPTHDVDSYSTSPSYSFPSWGLSRRSSRGAASEGGHTRVYPGTPKDWHPSTRSTHVNPSTAPLHSRAQSPSCDATCHKSVALTSRRATFTIEPIEPIDSTRLPYHDYLPNETFPAVRGNEGTPSPKRRWTLAMAITDEGITDEVLVEEFERLRMRREVSDNDKQTEGLCLDLDDRWDVWEADRGASWGSNESSEVSVCNDDPRGPSNIPYTPSLPSFPIPTPTRLSPSKPATRSATTPSASWHAARRALLTCRELIRTERHYLSSLQSLLASETATAPPALMLRYIEGLVCVSQSFLQHMEEDPSAWGVAAAFLTVEHGLECAFVGWCGVVGGWFEGQEGRTKRKGSKIPFEGQRDVAGCTSVDGRSPLKRSGTSPWRINVPSLNSIALPPMTSSVSPSAFLSRRREKDKARERERPPSMDGARRRRPSVRDLAILPTQRIMRYVLLYRDLLNYTPSTSPSRALVQRAVEAACRVAQKCDRAQGNATFLQQS